jgi:hypothetical protein
MSSLHRALRAALIALPLAVLSACGVTGQRADLSTSSYAPPMRWDHRPEAQAWTRTSFEALSTHGAALPATIPRDISTWCPGYADATEAERKAFWTGLISALAKHESTWNPAAVGGGGRWFGLTQISPSTARLYGCEARTGNALKDGQANLSCAIRIMARTVERDGVVSAGMRGVAADWGPFHSSSKRADMIAWTSAQPYCQPGAPERGLFAAARNP